jgi:UDP-glucuronate decarboxylase
MKTILISGGAGFIGSNLCHILIHTHKVICIDNFYTGSIKNIESLLKHPNFIFINHNIIEPFTIQHKIDEIYHLACPASPKEYQKDPIFTLKTNFMGSLHMLELAKAHNAKILLTSTSEIYGEPTISPQHENYRGNVNTTGIRSCYDEGKRISETLFADYARFYGLNIRIARIFNTYGPRMSKYDGRVVTNFISQMCENKDITIYGNGQQTRSFCYIDDTIYGLISLMNSDCSFPINIGNTKEITIKELVVILQSLMPNSTSKIVYKPLPSDDPTNRRPNIELAQKFLYWKPKTKLEDGLKKTITYILQT